MATGACLHVPLERNKPLQANYVVGVNGNMQAGLALLGHLQESMDVFSLGSPSYGS